MMRLAQFIAETTCALGHWLVNLGLELHRRWQTPYWRRLERLQAAIEAEKAEVDDEQ